MIGEQQIIPYYSPITSKGGKGKKKRTRKHKKSKKCKTKRTY